MDFAGKQDPPWPLRYTLEHFIKAGMMARRVPILGTVELFNAILDVTKLDAGVVHPQLAPVRIRKLFLPLADEFAPEADRKGLSLRVRTPDAWVESDAILLERICRNLLSNALLHTTQGGVLLSARPYRGQLRLQIWDTGSGIAAEHQPRIFDEFYPWRSSPRSRTASPTIPASYSSS